MGNACARPGQQDQVDLEHLRMKRATSADRGDLYGRGGSMNGGMHSYNVMNPAETGSMENSWDRRSTYATSDPPNRKGSVIKK